MGCIIKAEIENFNFKLLKKKQHVKNNTIA